MEELTKKTSFWTFDNLAFWVLSLGVILLPWFNLSFWGTSLDISKKILLVGAVFLALVLWLLGRLQEGRLVVPRNLILAGALLVLFATFISAVFSGSFWASFTGLGLELDTVLSISLLVFLLLLFSLYFQTRRRFLGLYLAIFITSFVVFLIEFLTILIFRTNFLSFAKPLLLLLSNGLFFSVIGKWYDLGVYFGFVALSTLIMLELFSIEKMPLFKFFLWICFATSLIVLAFINYPSVWIVLGVFALVIFVYKISFWNWREKITTDLESVSGLTKVFIPSFFVILIVLAFVILGSADKIGKNINAFSEQLGISKLEVKPSWKGTGLLVKNSLYHHPLLGAGPNSFAKDWARYKPNDINSTPYWNVDFRSGVGFIPSTPVSVGFLGFLAWLAFFAAIVWYGIKFIFSVKQDRSTRALLILSFCGAVYLWIFTTIYTPDNALLAFAFIVTGLFSAILTDTKIIKNYELALTKDPRANFISVLFFVVFIVGSITAGYLVLQKYVSVYIYQKGLYTLNVSGDLNKAYGLVQNAANLSGQDLYYRTLADMDVMQISRLLAQTGLSKEEIRARFLSLLDSATKNAKKAVDLDSQNYLNWLKLGKIYQAVVPLGINGSYEQGKEAYTKALSLNPANPSILLDYFARLEIDNKNIAKAKEYIKQSLVLKNDYPEATLLLAQIDTEEGNPDVGVRRLDEFYANFPQNTDANFLFQLGFMKYRRGNYSGAILALERSVALLPSYANAKYFLALSYAESGNQAKALNLLADIQKVNPNSQELKQAILDVQNGKSVMASPILNNSASSTITKATSTEKTKKK